mmetsp:Transcript_3621/g.7941  ORF Transcript_3621/g.7941 Transcript_3621/m.7941 type:complete len:108 (+) Transcript_3621:127-450(+)|eukprot:CAMPEP_0178381854 /NCGR_PEP_ID=MMETSP0689_2-20121128/6199_1 /TAXON_ID=160604 /ORGANISM="Amphidinium massartii, Strain CS-259" /LENGTH=107 /DNA_ID=CAMNT_0020002053 /DNA_START=17 /DNA_END=340 /DNA_ORIENTATION=+
MAAELRFQLTVHCLSGSSSLVNACGSDTVVDLKAKVAEMDGVPPGRITLCAVVKGSLVALEDAATLHTQGVAGSDEVFVRRREHAPMAAEFRHLTVLGDPSWASAAQ